MSDSRRRFLSHSIFWGPLLALFLAGCESLSDTSGTTPPRIVDHYIYTFRIEPDVGQPGEPISLMDVQCPSGKIYDTNYYGVVLPNRKAYLQIRHLSDNPNEDFFQEVYEYIEVGYLQESGQLALPNVLYVEYESDNYHGITKNLSHLKSCEGLSAEALHRSLTPAQRDRVVLGYADSLENKREPYVVGDRRFARLNHRDELPDPLTDVKLVLYKRAKGSYSAIDSVQLFLNGSHPYEIFSAFGQRAKLFEKLPYFVD